MIVCPRCSHENKDSAMNCASCRINLQWALENPHEAVRPTLEGVRGPPAEPQAESRVIRVFPIIVLLLAIPVAGFLAFWFYLNACFSQGSAQHGYLAGALFCVLVAVVCIFTAIAVLLPRHLRRRYYRGLGILALVALAGGLLFGLMRLALVLLPEHTGQSLIIQYKLGERDFSGVSLVGADLNGADLRVANLSGAGLSQADLTKANLSWTDLSGTDLREANLSGARLTGADLSDADLHEADLRGADLYATNLPGAVLDKANLSGANLRRADLSGASLCQAILRDADLRQANLREADLSESDLSGAVLYGSDQFTLLEADLSGTILSRANLSGATVTNKQLAKAKSLEGMILPNGAVHK